MTAKILVTLAWAAALAGANNLLTGTEWAQYVVTFVLGGAYVLLINKVSNPPARNNQNQEAVFQTVPLKAGAPALSTRAGASCGLPAGQAESALQN